MRSFKFTVVATMVVAMLSWASVEAADITATALNYASFEYPLDTYPQGTTVGPEWNPNISGLYKNGVADLPLGAASDGLRFYFSNPNESITQHASGSVTVLANTVYTLSVDIGDSRSIDDPTRLASGTIDLFVHTAAQSGGEISGTQGTDWEVATAAFYSETGAALDGLAGDTYSLTLDTSDATYSPFVGGTMTVRISTDDTEGGNYPWMDNVRLTVNVVPVPGDANYSGVVDGEDAAILAANWLGSGGWGEGDFNGDTIVDDKDATIMAANWGAGNANAAVPEPGTIVLLISMTVLVFPVGFARIRAWRRRLS